RTVAAAGRTLGPRRHHRRGRHELPAPDRRRRAARGAARRGGTGRAPGLTGPSPTPRLTTAARATDTSPPGTHVNVLEMQNKNLYLTLKSGFPESPDAPALETETGAVHTYGELERASARYANLIASQGVMPGDRIVVQIDKSPEALFLYLACLRAGAIFVPLNSAYQRKELAYFLADAEPRMVVCSPSHEDLFLDIATEAGNPTVLTLGDHGNGTAAERASTMSEQFETVHREDDDLACILYTS